MDVKVTRMAMLCDHCEGEIWVPDLTVERTEEESAQQQQAHIEAHRPVCPALS